MQLVVVSKTTMTHDSAMTIIFHTNRD